MKIYIFYQKRKRKRYNFKKLLLQLTSLALITIAGPMIIAILFIRQGNI